MKKLFPLATLTLTIVMIVLSHDLTKIVAWLILMLCYSKAKKSQNWYSPYYLFMVTIISYILYWERLGGIFMDELSLGTRIFIISGLLAVVVGFIVCQNANRTPIRVGKMNENFWIVFFIGLLPTALSYMMYGNIATLEGEELLEAKEKFSLPVIGQLAYFLPASIVVACKKNNSTLIILASAFSIVAALLTISKTAMLLTLLYFIIGTTEFQPTITHSKLYKMADRYKFVAIPILLIVVFMFNNNKRHGEDTNMTYVETSTSDLWSNSNLVQNLFLDYCYYVQPWSNLNYNIERNHNQGAIGGNSFSQFGKKLGIHIKARHKIQPYFFNTHTFLTDYYLDFGPVFAVIICFLLGILIYTCYSLYGLSDDPLLISFYILIAYATVMMFFSNHFNNGYLMNYFITFGLVSLFSRLSDKSTSIR